MKNITVLGLGEMGSTLADLFLARGRRVTVWNRTAAKMERLEEKGARAAGSVAEAVHAGELVVMCVSDYAAAREILNSLGAPEAVQSRTLLQLTTGSPEDAKSLEAWVQAQGGTYLDGAIQAAPSQMGEPDTPVLISGAEATYSAAREILADIAGNVIYLGPAIEAAASVDAATLSYVYGSMLGFIQGARMAEHAGVSVARYGSIVKDISPSFGAFFEHEGRVIDSGDFSITESPMRISIDATHRILDMTRAAGIDDEIPAFTYGFLERAQKAGLADKELAALIELVRE